MPVCKCKSRNFMSAISRHQGLSPSSTVQYSTSASCAWHAHGPIVGLLGLVSYFRWICSLLFTCVRKPPPLIWVDETELTFARLAEWCGKSDFYADGRVELHIVSSTNNIWRKLTKNLVEELSFFKDDMSLSLFLGRTSSNFDRVFTWYGDINDICLLTISHIDIIYHL